MPFHVSKNNQAQSLAECSLTDALLEKLCVQNKDYETKKFGFLGSFFVVHIGGSLTTVATGVCDALFQLTVGIVKLVPGIFISLLNLCRAPFVSSKAKAYAPEWDLFASITHLGHGIKSALTILPIFFETLLCDPREVRKSFFKYNVLRENRLEDEAAIAKLKTEKKNASPQAPNTPTPPSQPVPPMPSENPAPPMNPPLSSPPAKPVPATPSDNPIEPEPKLTDIPEAPQSPPKPEPMKRGAPPLAPRPLPFRNSTAKITPPALDKKPAGEAAATFAVDPNEANPEPVKTKSNRDAIPADDPRTIEANKRRAAMAPDDSELWDSQL